MIMSMALLVALVSLLSNWFQKRKWNQERLQKEQESEYQQKMLRLALEAQENERKRVSGSLQEEVGVLLQALNNTFALIKNAPEDDKKEVKDLVTQLTETVRRISWDLMPSSLERFGLTEAIDELCSRLSSRCNVGVTFTAEGTPSPLDKNQEILLYRIVQEAVENALKHAKATQVQVQFSWCDAELCIEVRDNGTGFEMPKKNKNNFNQYGLGLFNIQNRAGLLQGSVSFRTNQPTGTVVKIILPQSGYAKN